MDATRTPDRLFSAPDPTLGSKPRCFLNGLQSAFAGVAFTFRHGRMLGWMAAAVALYLLIWVAVLWAAAAWDDDFAQTLLWVRGPSWWESALWQISRVLIYIVFWIIALLLAFSIALPLMAPMFTLLSEMVERSFYGDIAGATGTPAVLARELINSLARSLLLSTLNILGAATIWGIGLLLGLIFPPLGTVFGVAVGGGWSALWFVFIGMTYVLENNRTSLSQQVRLPGRHTALLLGFGTVAQVMAWLPPTVPMIIVSATVLCCRLNRHGHIPMPIRDEWEASLGPESP